MPLYTVIYSISLSRSLSLSLSPLVLSPSTFIMLHHFFRMPSPCCIVSVQLLNVFSPLFIASQHCSSLIALPVPTLEQIFPALQKCIYIYIYTQIKVFRENSNPAFTHSKAGVRTECSLSMVKKSAVAVFIDKMQVK